jgi:hypothetical protein
MDELKEWATPRQSEIIDAVIKCGTQSAAAEMLGISKRTLERGLQRVRNKAARQGYSPQHNMVHTAPDTHVVKGVSTFYDESGNPIRQWVKTDLKKDMAVEAIHALVDGLKGELRGVHTSRPAPECANDDLMACYMLGDHHLGMIAIPERTGGQPYDLDIAEALVVQATTKLARRNKDARHALLVNLGDFFHANDQTGQTPASKHNLDVDRTFADAIRTAARIYRSLVQILLETHETVTIINARGNHDTDSALWLNEMLRELYADDPRVTITNNATKFVHHRFGKNLIVTHHGNRIKPEKLCEHACKNLAKDWGECEHRFGWMGHIHHQTQKELGHGMLVESWSVLCAPDSYAADHGYSQNRSMSCVVLHREYGEDCRYKVGIKELDTDIRVC